MSRGVQLTREQRELILAKYKSGLTYKQVADEMNVSHATVGNIVRASGYDRYHVGSSIAKSIPVANTQPSQSPAKAAESRQEMRVISRTQKLQSPVTGFTYTVSTDSDVVEIESDSALMSIRVQDIEAYIKELQDICKMLGNRPS